MKKKYILVFLLIVLLVCCSTVYCVIIKNKTKSEELEAIDIFDENVAIQVLIKRRTNNVNDIKNKIENIEYVKSVEFISKENALKAIKDKFSNMNWIADADANVLQDSFIIKLKINNLKKLEEIEKSVINAISEIDGIDKIESGVGIFIRTYKEKGIEGLKDYYNQKK